MNPHTLIKSIAGRLSAARGRRALSGMRGVIVLLLSGGLFVFSSCVGVAGAAVVHVFDGGLSGALDAGVPRSASAAEARITGPLSNPSSIAIDEGHVWIAERLNSGRFLSQSRVDEFDASTGAFLPAQLEEEDEVNELHFGVAVGHPEHQEQVYVGAGRNGRYVVAVYGASRKLLGVWAGPGAGFAVITAVAVDGSGDLETQGDVFVADGGGTSPGVDVFAPRAGGAEPSLLGRVTGTPAGPFGAVFGVAVSPVSGDLLVAATGGSSECVKGVCGVDIFAPVPGSPGTYAFTQNIPGPTPSGAFGDLRAVAGDDEGDIYAEEDHGVVDQFSPAGVLVGRVEGTPSGGFHSVEGLADDGKRLFVGESNPTTRLGAVDVFGPSLVVPDVTVGAPALSVGASDVVSAALTGTVNPLDQGPASCAFKVALVGEDAKSVPCSGQVANGDSPVEVSGALEGLLPDTEYAVQLQATNANGTNEQGETRSFLTPGPGLQGAWASEVSSTSVTLNASIDPNSASTSYYFQYGLGIGYGGEAPAAPGSLVGFGKGAVAVVPRHLDGLAPASTYHYRVVAVSTLMVAGVPTPVSFYGADQTFSTQPAGAESGLLDGRRWELVSPADKHGAVLQPISAAGVIEAAASGDAVTYLANRPTEEVPGYEYEGVQLFGTRGAGGWSSRDVATAHGQVASYAGNFGKEFRSFSSDLTSAIVEPLGEFTSLAPESFPPDTERGPYVRHDTTCASEPSTCYEPLVTGAPGYSDVPEGTKIGGNPQKQGLEHFFGSVGVEGASSDLSKIILGSRTQLTATATAGQEELYEWSAGAPASNRLELVSWLPPNAKRESLPAAGARLDTGRINVQPVSSDGSRVVWSAEVENQRHLYLRDIPKHETVQLDVPEPACVAEEECEALEATELLVFQSAAADGSRVLFTDKQRLTKDAGHVRGEPDLYECAIVEVAGALTCELTDLTPAPGAGQAADVQGDVLGTSENGRWVYFVANGLLGNASEQGYSTGDCAPEFGTEATGTGSCFLYLAHDGATRVIAHVDGADIQDWFTILQSHTSRVSPNGEWLAFMSRASLTGYDNHDVASGEPDEEVYLDHATPEGQGRLVCASCNPTGQRPEGVEDAQINGHLAGGSQVWGLKEWIAANIPGWTPFAGNESRYQSRYLSDTGRLFFNSSDALVPQDVNHNEDVYEYEPTGAGTCTGDAPQYAAGSEGCLALISSGRAAGESAFMDASESGNDVFFLTSERLVAKDTDSSLDLYDAHACTPEACNPDPEPPPACTTAGECRPAPAPQPSIFGLPASATFSGPGNFAAPSSAAVVTSSSKPTKAQLLSKALSSCRKKYEKQKKRRGTCEAQARKRYGLAKPAAKKTKKKQGGHR